MGLFKKNATFGKGIYVRCLSLWVSTEATDPVIQVIYCDEQYVRLRRSLSLPSPQEYETQDGLDNETSLYTA